MDSIWYSLGPLVAFNVLMLVTVVVYSVIGNHIPVDKEVNERHASKFLNRWFRAYWIWLISPVERFFVRTHISPNLLTVIGLIISGVLAGAFYATGHLGLAGWMVIIGGTFDMFDGRVARATGQTTQSGAYFDAVIDRYSEGIAYFGLIYFYRDHWMIWVVLFAFLGAFMVSYSKARGEAMGLEVKSGAMQRPERIVYLGVASIFSPVVRLLTAHYSPFPYEELLLIASLGLIAVSTNWSAITRMKEVMHQLRQKER